MRVVMAIADGPFEGRKVVLQAGQSIKVGRTEYADFCVPHDDLISGVHFALDCEQDRCIVRDLRSTNGTTVNGMPVTEAELADGNLIVAGTTTFRVSVEVTEAAFDANPNRLADKADQPSSKPWKTTKATAIVPAKHAPPSPALMLASGAERPYVAGLQDDDPDVRREALHAAAWSGEAWLLPYCRILAREPNAEQWDALRLLAVLGEPSDLNLILRIGRTVALGSRRFEVYASYGHPQTVQDLLMAIESDDPKAAVAAGAAFCKMTGAEIDSDHPAGARPETSGDAEEAESEPDEAVLPNARLVREHWSRVKDSFAAGTRWRKGLNLSDNRGVEVIDQLDMEARWELGLRMAAHRLPFRQCLPPMLRQGELK